jgi:hypothetical protein
MLLTWAALRASIVKQQISKTAVLKHIVKKEKKERVIQLWDCSHAKEKVFVWYIELIKKGWPA